MRRPSLAIGAVALLLAASAQARADDPTALRRLLDDKMKTCPAAQKAGRLPDGYVVRGEFNGDGILDFIVDANIDPCPDLSMCGSAGCDVSALISTPSGHRQVSLGNLRGFSVVRNGDKDVLRVALHGSACGKVGAASCEKQLAWNGSRFVPVATGTRSSKPGEQPVTPGRGAPYGVWVQLENGDRCIDGGSGIFISPGTIKVDYAGYSTTFAPVTFSGCKDDLCAFKRRGTRLEWTARWLGPDRIEFRGPHMNRGVVTSRAQRESSIPGCTASR